MSKIIRLTDELRAEAVREFDESLRKGAKIADGKVSFTKTFDSSDEKANVFFSPDAYIKMFCLLQEFGKEVAWHGVTYRMDSVDGSHNYLINDIVVYPQEVTSTTVEMDTEKYAIWLMENDEDERFAHLHMQGHSHVNMGTTPSGVDLNHQEEILAQLGDEDFYIFMIYNKSLKHTVKIYDMRDNIMFEDKDISVRVLGAVTGLDEFIKDAKDKVKDRPYTYNGYNSYNKNTPSTPKSAPSTPATPSKTPASQAPASAPYNPLGGSKPSTPATPSAPTDKPKTQIGAGWQGAKNACEQTSMYDPDDLDDPYGPYGWRE